MVSLSQPKYNRLAEKKATLEESVGQHFDWGTFLIILASTRSSESETEQFAELHDSGVEGEANPEDYEEIPGWVTRAGVEEIVRSHADRIITELGNQWRQQ